MPQKSPEQWTQIREEYEKGATLVKDLAAKWDVSTEAIRKRARREHWISAKVIERRAKLKLNRRDAAVIEEESDRLLEDYLLAKLSVAEASVLLLHRFQQEAEAGEIQIRSAREALAVLEALERLSGQDPKPSITVNHVPPPLGINLGGTKPKSITRGNGEVIQMGG